mgnify:FL=1
MAADQSQKNEFLLKEYDTAIQLTLHVDELRSRFTNLFITIAGVVAAVISLLLQENTNGNTFGKLEVVAGIILILIALVGLLVIAVIARLRKVQLENFRITNNIRKHFLGNSYSLWNVVELSGDTLPMPNMHSGTYYWSMVIMLLNSYTAALAIYLFLAQVWKLATPPNSFVLAIVGGLIFIVLQNVIYFRLAIPPAPRIYSKDNPPN